MLETSIELLLNPIGQFTPRVKDAIHLHPEGKKTKVKRKTKPKRNKSHTSTPAGAGDKEDVDPALVEEVDDIRMDDDVDRSEPIEVDEARERGP